MTLEQIIIVVTPVVSFIFGTLAKKFNWMESKYIPIQNLVIGVIVSLLYYFMVDSSDIANAVIIAFSGLIAGGGYDLKKFRE